MVKNSKSTVYIVQQDRGQEETILQLAFALDSLEKVATNLFTQVENNLAKHKQRLADLQKRCLAVKCKVDNVTGINKSITVFCSSKYPGTSKDRIFKFDYKHVEIERPNYKVKYKPLPPEKLQLKEKLKFYHVKDIVHKLKKNIDILPLEGLGNIPDDLKSVSSLLLYNTKENLYKNYKLLDPLSSVFRSNPVEEVKNVDTVEPAPIPLGFNDDIEYRVRTGFFYAPSMGHVPSIEAPLDLPDLPGIAGDFCHSHGYFGDDESLVSKNVNVLSGTEDELPTVVEDLPKIVDSDVSIDHSLPNPIPQPPEPPPPPPPPPPLVMTPQVQEDPQKIEQGLIHPTPSGDNMRANLMEAIRNAGGSAKAKLRSIDKKEPLEVKKAVSGGSLMDDLHAKLSMRRKGISGKIENSESIVEKMVSMIPPPPTKEQEMEPDDEWED